MDNQPKRRKYKDNPYILESDKNLNFYRIIFTDGDGNKQSVEINHEMHCEFNNFELEDLREMNQYDRHIEHLEQTEEALYNKSKKQISVEEEVEIKMRNEELYKAINMLPEIQKRRIKMYYFEDMTLKEIAEKEGCHLMSVKDSITSGIEKLKKFLE